MGISQRLAGRRQALPGQLMDLPVVRQDQRMVLGLRVLQARLEPVLDLVPEQVMLELDCQHLDLVSVLDYFVGP
jgi:hypothetical protein